MQSHLPVTRIGLEASGRYGEPLADFLVVQNYPVSYLNPKQIHAFSKVYLNYNKTDKQDAALIARFCQMHSPDLWRPSSVQHKQLQQRSRRLHSLEKMRQQERNRLQSGMNDPFVVEQIQTLIAHFDTLIQHTQEAIQELIQQTHSLKQQQNLLVSIQGIGQKTAALLLAELGDVRRFDCASQLAALYRHYATTV